MTSPSPTRLERALELFVEHQRSGGDWQQLLREHPDLGDMLASFVEAPPAAPAAPADPAVFCPADFDWVREIGRGGVGIVHEARQRSLDRTVALKVLHDSFASSPTALARFRREAQALARLDHVGIVRVFAVGADQGRHWLAMELVEGSLAVHLDSLRGRGGHHGDSIRRLVESVAEVASALQYAHEAGIVHRDVKPSNILLRRDGTAVLGDFGLARDADAPSLTQTGVITGTPHYMAPEQVLGAGADWDARSDVFGLGASLYECLTLKYAFDGTSTQEVLQAVLSKDPVDPRRHQRGLPADLAAIVLKALEKNRERRYQSAGELAADLRAFLELRPIAARHLSTTRRLARLARRRPMLAAMLLLAGGAILVAGLVLWQLPNVRAAAVARANEAFEEEMVAGMMARNEASEEECYGHFRRAIELAPQRAEARVGLCFAMLRFAGPQAALDYLDRQGTGESDELGRCRALVLRRLQRLDEAKDLEQRLGPPTTAQDMLFAAVPALDDPGNESALREASRSLSLAIRIAPRPRLLLYTEWAGLQTLLDDPVQRRESIEALLRLWPDNVRALQTAGVNLLQVDPARGLSVLQHAVEVGPVDAMLWFNLGVAHYKNQNRDEALASVAKAMHAVGLTDAQRWDGLRIAHELGDTDLEASLAAEWLARDPRSLLARRAAARQALREGDRDRAIELLRECVAEAPDFDLRMDLAFTLSEGDDLTEAGELARALADEGPTIQWTHQLVLDICDLQHDEAAAMAEHGRWATANPTDASAWQTLAAAYLEAPAADANERALAASEHADYLTDGTDPGILALRARALDRLGRVEEATHVRARAASLPQAPR